MKHINRRNFLSLVGAAIVWPALPAGAKVKPSMTEDDLLKAINEIQEIGTIRVKAHGVYYLPGSKFHGMPWVNYTKIELFTHNGWIRVGTWNWNKMELIFNVFEEGFFQRVVRIPYDDIMTAALKPKLLHVRDYIAKETSL